MWEDRALQKDVPKQPVAYQEQHQTDGKRQRPSVAASAHCRATLVGKPQRGKGGTTGQWELARPGYSATPTPVLTSVTTKNRYSLLDVEEESTDDDSSSWTASSSGTSGSQLEGEKRQKPRMKRK